MSCKDCIHFGICKKGFPWADGKGGGWCEDFKDKSLYIKLPCKVGDNVYILSQKSIQEYIVYSIEYTDNTLTIKCHSWLAECEGMLHKHIAYFDKNDFNKTVFFTRKDAEKILAERNKG